MSFRLNCASCSSKLYLCLHLANCSNLFLAIAFLANFHLTFSFLALGRAIQFHCSWCICRFEELPFSYSSFQLAIFWWGELGIHCLLLFLLHVFFFFFPNPMCCQRSFGAHGSASHLLWTRIWRWLLLSLLGSPSPSRVLAWGQSTWQREYVASWWESVVKF